MRRTPPTGNGLPPRARQDQWRRPSHYQPVGWNQPAPRTARHHHGPSLHRSWLLALVLVLTLAAAAWFFVLRDAEPSSRFVLAFDRYSAAAERIREGANDVQRFLELPQYERVVDGQLLIMGKQERVFRRLARTEDGEAQRIAREAVEATKRATYSAYWYSRGILTRRLSTAAAANAELGAALVELNQLTDQWKNLSR